MFMNFKDKLQVETFISLFSQKLPLCLIKIVLGENNFYVKF